MTETQKGAEARGDVLGRTGAAVPTLLLDKVEDSRRAEIVKTKPRHLRSRREKEAGDMEVACDRRSRETALLDEIDAKVLDQSVSRFVGMVDSTTGTAPK